MANPDRLNDDLYDFDAEGNPYFQNQAWSMTIDQMESIAADTRRNVSPIHTNITGLRQTTMAEHPMMDTWIYQQMQQQQPQQLQVQMQHQVSDQHIHQQMQAQLDYDHAQHALDLSYNYNISLPPQLSMVAATQAALSNSIPMDQGFVTMPSNWDDLQSQLVQQTLTDMGIVSPHQQPTASPTNSHVEVMSQPSSAEDGSWISSERHSFESSFERPGFVDPTKTLHDWSQAVYSPTNLSDSSDYEYVQAGHSHGHGHVHGHNHEHTHDVTDSQVVISRPVHPSAFVRPIAIPSSSKAPSSKGSSPGRSPTSTASASSPGRKPSKKSPIAAKVTDNRVSKKTANADKSAAAEKRVGRRKGPLSIEQRKQASEIRKLRACLRCKFLKKTCDTGDPCSGCQPSHARLWQVPCTRIDIKDIGYFLKDRKFDYERHVSLGFSAANLMGFSDVETTLHITHGYGHMLPVIAREVFIRNEDCLKMDWREANRDPNGYEVPTAKLSAGAEGISTTMLSDYLDRHIDCEGTFEKFVDDYFEGTPFLSDMLKVAFHFYLRTKSKIIKKALKLMLAYNLTLHITMVEGRPIEEEFVGRIEDESSRFFGKTMAPVMINFQIKVAMSDMWRELHKDVLEELSSLYSSVYNGDKLKNWPTIFILASVLLAVWECMQFDCHYRVPDEASVNKFCSDMETTPVGVIVGLFSAISQKLPSILEWDSQKHHFLLGSDGDVCQTMTEVRDHVARYESYLRDRPGAKFDSNDFDSLSNKFLSRLVFRDIRAN